MWRVAFVATGAQVLPVLYEFMCRAYHQKQACHCVLMEWDRARGREVGFREQCSRLKPSYEFRFEGFSNFGPPVEGLFQI
jgi:hypothetical protein